MTIMNYEIMFTNLTDQLQGILHSIKGQDKLTSASIDKALIEIRRALIEADVNLTVIKSFLSSVRTSAIGVKVVQGLTPAQKFIQIVNDELIQLLGAEATPLQITANNKAPEYILMMGLQGSGKTTTSAKLALTLQKQYPNKKILLVALDLKRPAAIDQLCILGESINIPVFANKDINSTLDHTENTIKYVNENNFDIVILDTAGRLSVDSDLMAELLLISKLTKPVEQLLVIDSLIGQKATEIAQTFDSQIGITGSILTKMDSDSRGGSALSLVKLTNKPIKYIGTGEKIDLLDTFEPSRIADRILGYGDIISLVNKVEESISEKESKALEQQLKQGKLNFDMFLQMQRLLSKLGGLSSVFNLMGLGNMLNINKENKEELLTDGTIKFRRYEFIIQSMTRAERLEPALLKNNKSRIKRIAKGSSQDITEVSNLITEFLQMQDMMKLIAPFLQGGKSGNPMPNPMDLLNMNNKLQQEKKKTKKSKSQFFGGGNFIKF